MQEGGRQGDEEGAEGWQQEQQGRLPGCLPHRYTDEIPSEITFIKA